MRIDSRRQRCDGDMKLPARVDFAMIKSASMDSNNPEGSENLTPARV